MLGALVLDDDVALCIDDHDRIGERVHDRRQHFALLIQPSGGETEFLDSSHARQYRSRQSRRVHQRAQNVVVEAGFEQHYPSGSVPEFSSPVDDCSPAHLAAGQVDHVELAVAEKVRRAPKLGLRERDRRPLPEGNPL